MKRAIDKKSVTAGALEVLNVTNPLLLRDEETARIKCFIDLPSMYTFLLDYLFRHYPRGYLEPSYFVTTYYGADSYKTRDELRHGFKLGGTKPWVLILNWWNMSKDQVEELWKFVESLHRLLGTQGNYSMFLEGVRKFKLLTKFINEDGDYEKSDRTLYTGGAQ